MEEKALSPLTDTTNSPSQLAHYLLSFGMSEYKAFVAENLGGESERYAWYDLEEMENREFSPLNIVIFKKDIRCKNMVLWNR